MYGGDGQDIFYDILTMFEVDNSAEDAYTDDFEICLLYTSHAVRATPGYRAIRAGILYPLPDYRRVHMESRNDGQMVLAKRKRQGPGDTQKMGGTRK